ncbi:hypothetical protein ACHAW5_005093 [Stephanodiscus triporus]|uniref:Uncharacterized protein n=1 Tax=Stephanodiscus triporus TaxID=2934178 RepID=A0ABD3PRD0_9STRA
MVIKSHTPTAEETIAMSSIIFPSSPDHASANAMLAYRKQQLAHLQTLQRQQQQVLQQMSGRNASSPVSMMMNNGGYADGRDDGFSASGLRSAHATPTAGSTVSFASFPQPASPRRTTFECDYDTNPTELYLAVQRKDWEAAVERAATFPQEASTWVSRKEADGKLRWRLLPLHAAIIFRAPERIISALLSAFPQGAACKDDQGMLPLHLAFRNGCDEDIVDLLLMAYPQSIDVQDRKGRTPMVLAQQSTHANRDKYIRALEKGPAYYAVANAAKDGSALSVVPSMPIAYQSYQMSPTMMQTATGDDRVNELVAELTKTQETSQVLVDHVNALEAQLASRSDTERFLATKIANLDQQLKATNVTLEEAKSEIEAKKLELSKKDEEAAEEAKKVEMKIAELNAALADKKAAELKSYKLTNKERFDLEERVEVSERECAAAQANAAILEAQLRKKVETEQSLASQVSMLASQLASSATASSEAAGSYQRKCESLMTENKKLQSHVNELEKKLATVAVALDAMAAEQERIVEAASKHEKTMMACTQVNQTIVADTMRQETLLEDAAREREQIVSILMRQAEDAERTMSDRERLLEAVKAQEGDIARATEERDAVIESVSKQREYMDFMLNGELAFLKRTVSEDKCDLVNEEKMQAMQSKMAEFISNKEASEDVAQDTEGLDETADPVMEAMKLAQDAVEKDVEGDDEEEEEEEEVDDEENVDSENIGVVCVESSEKGYATPSEDAEDEDDEIDAAISAASSEDSESS